jgi:hypothetical protein
MMDEQQKSLPAENGSTGLPEPPVPEDEIRSTNAEKSEEITTQKSNPDSKGLGWYGNDHIVIGCVDEVNGPGSIEFPSFVPTQHELIQLAKYWATVRTDLGFSYFVDGQTGSTEIRLGPFASRRIARIAAVLGEEEVATAVKEAYDEFGKGIDPKTWNIFMNGTREERESLQAEIAREMSGTEDPQVVAGITELMQSLGLDFPGTGRKAVRFAILSSPAAAVVNDPLCVIVPILEYLNADENDGRYKKDIDGSLLPMEWELRHVALSPLELNRIQRLPDPEQAVDDVDVVMLCTGPAAAREFSRASNSARWKKNPEVVAEVEMVAADASAALAAKIAGCNGMTLYDNFQAASAALK